MNTRYRKACSWYNCFSLSKGFIFAYVLIDYFLYFSHTGYGYSGSWHSCVDLQFPCTRPYTENVIIKINNKNRHAMAIILIANNHKQSKVLGIVSCQGTLPYRSHIHTKCKGVYGKCMLMLCGWPHNPACKNSTIVPGFPCCLLSIISGQWSFKTVQVLIIS